MSDKQRKLFCEISPFTFFISTEKERAIRYTKWIKNQKTFAKEHKNEKLNNLVYSYSNKIIKVGKDINPVLQENKAVNIDIASKSISGLIIHPGEIFSFWYTVGNTTKRKGYKDGRIIKNKKLVKGIGGGLCNLAHTIHLLAIHSPLDIIEAHFHSDALVPEPNGHVPFSTGTSVEYNYEDLMFQNNTSQDVQLILYVENGYSYAELRSVEPFPYEYKIVEENHHFRKEGNSYFRVSRIYRETIDKKTNKAIKKELVRNNHSKVMYDYSEIPQEFIRSR